MAGPGRLACRGPLRFAVLPDDYPGGNHGARRQLLELHLRDGMLAGGVLGSDGRLDAVEEAFQPPDQLRLGDPELGVRRRGVVREGEADPFQFLHEFGGQPVLQFLDGTLVDLGQAFARGVVQRG